MLFSKVLRHGAEWRRERTCGRRSVAVPALLYALQSIGPLESTCPRQNGRNGDCDERSTEMWCENRLEENLESERV